ncbi:MAG: DUF4173 domain-containing protein [Lachnospiraceae bacterium]|nr:DUF4173 domain-containing protein [Lachnospiraceae bacterium]
MNENDMTQAGTPAAGAPGAAPQGAPQPRFDIYTGRPLPQAGQAVSGAVSAAAPGAAPQGPAQTAPQGARFDIYTGQPLPQAGQAAPGAGPNGVPNAGARGAYPGGPVIAGQYNAAPAGPRPSAPDPVTEENRPALRKLVPLAAIFSVVTLICLYHNGRGIFVLPWALVTVVLSLKAAQVLERPVSRWNVFWLAGILLLSVSNIWTNRDFIVGMNWIGITVLGTMYILDLWRDMGAFRPVRTLGMGIMLWLEGIVCMTVPFRLKERGVQAEEKKRLPWRSIGIGAAAFFVCIPLLWIVCSLLASADVIFERVMDSILKIPEWLHLDERIVIYAIWLIVGFFLFFCLHCSGLRRSRIAERERTASVEPLAAVVGLTMFSIFYGIFCVIQIVYLFAGGKLGLPEGVTFASYAREGFFQLLFVAVLNLIAVLAVTSIFRESRLLKGLLTFICLCTYVMIASALMRMILYVQAYSLSFERVLVLWFLPCLVLLVTGALVSLYRPKMRLMRFFTVVMLLGWLVFAFGRPDALIARYNLSGHSARVDYDYLARQLSTDAAPVVLEHADELPEHSRKRLMERIDRAADDMDLRTFNLSVWQAQRAANKVRGGQN